MIECILPEQNEKYTIALQIGFPERGQLYPAQLTISSGTFLGKYTLLLVKKGRNKLVFTDISTVADQKSVQFNSNKAFNLVSVSSEIDYISFVDNNPRIKILQDSLQLMRDKLIDLHSFLFPEYYKEGKHYFRIGIGCTGGKHRSVAIAERLARELMNRSLPQLAVSVSHRDIDVSV